MRLTNIHKYVAVAALCVASVLPVDGQRMVTERAIINGGSICGIEISDVAIERNASLMTVDMDFATGKFDIGGNRAVMFAPMIVNGPDTLVLKAFCLYSRTRWYQFLRSGEKPFIREDETAIRWSERPAEVNYSQTIPYAEWMNGSQLWLRRWDYGCRDALIIEDAKPLLTNLRELKYTPVFHYVRPAVETDKTRELVGRAYIDFPVNRTELYPDYRKNPVELAKIIATIDSVRNDKDVTVRRITIKGWASPESSWENNTRLAKGRTATLKQYVQNLYHFPEGFIETDYYPEDWIGLREFVAQSGLEHRKEILAIIDSNLEPDPKEWKLKSTYPEEYQFLLQTVYPGLRHSDYTIEYTIRQFTDLAEIRQTLATAPQKLSLNEMFLLAQSMEQGSREYNEVFETAVRMYPADRVANLNAANAAMARNDMETAAKYLEKAGDYPETKYAKGVWAAIKGDYDTAIQLFAQVEDSLPVAKEALATVREIQKNSGK